MKDDLTKELEQYKKDTTRLDIDKQSVESDFCSDSLFHILCRLIFVVIFLILYLYVLA